MKTIMALERATLPASFRRAWLMRRAWRPTWVSPISPSISALGTRAATESMTMMSTAPEGTSIDDVERVLGVDEGGDPAQLLGLGDGVEAEGGLAARLRPVDLDDPAPGQAPDAEGDVEPERSGGDGVDADGGVVAQPHDRALAEVLLDLGEGHVQGLLPLVAPALGIGRCASVYCHPCLLGPVS